MPLCPFIWHSLWNFGAAKCFGILTTTTTTLFVTNASYISYHNDISTQNLIPPVSRSEKTARYLPFKVSCLRVDLFWRLMVNLLTRSLKLRHYNDIKMSTSAYLPCRKSLTLKSPETRLFDQMFVRDNSTHKMACKAESVFLWTRHHFFTCNRKSSARMNTFISSKRTAKCFDMLTATHVTHASHT